MFTKLEQRSWLKLKQAGAKQQKSYRGLEEVCGTAALPYRTVARWVQTFRCRPLRPDHQQNRGLPKASCDSLIAGNVFYITLGEYIEGLWKYELCRCAVSKVTEALPKLKFQPSYFVQRWPFPFSFLLWSSVFFFKYMTFVTSFVTGIGSFRVAVQQYQISELSTLWRLTRGQQPTCEAVWIL